MALVLDPAILEALSTAPRSSCASGPRRTPTPLRAQLAEADAQLARLTEALTLGGGSAAALVKQLKVVQARRDQLTADLAAITGPARQAPRDLRRQLDARLADWKGAMHRNVQRARQLLRKLVVGRIVLTPGPAGVAFRAEVTFGKLLTGLGDTTGLVSRPGREPGPLIKRGGNP